MRPGDFSNDEPSQPEAGVDIPIVRSRDSALEGIAYLPQRRRIVTDRRQLAR
jgi:hypothetical protein